MPPRFLVVPFRNGIDIHDCETETITPGDTSTSSGRDAVAALLDSLATTLADQRATIASQGDRIAQLEDERETLSQANERLAALPTPADPRFVLVDTATGHALVDTFVGENTYLGELPSDGLAKLQAVLNALWSQYGVAVAMLGDQMDRAAAVPTPDVGSWFDARVRHEREKQDIQWSARPVMGLRDWVSVLAEEAGEAAKEMCNVEVGGDPDAALDELVQVAAVCRWIAETGVLREPPPTREAMQELIDALPTCACGAVATYHVDGRWYACDTHERGRSEELSYAAQVRKGRNP
jgi:hypothetical protein